MINDHFNFKLQLLVTILRSEVVQPESGEVGEEKEEGFWAEQTEYIPNLALLAVVR